jgi:hypothetical protein
MVRVYLVKEGHYCGPSWIVNVRMVRFGATRSSTLQPIC